ncbi:MAG: hypothetical protein Q8N37_03780 [bacterium]|nr:hypothetical protein [bacterium]
MKAIAHAWLALMAMQRLRCSKDSSFFSGNFQNFFLGDKFDPYFQIQAEKFVIFFDKHKDAFVQGAWFPDNVISDNLTGGHTFKLRKPVNETEIKNSREITNFTPKHLCSLKALGIQESRLKEKLYMEDGYNLPDRCEALSHSIRDMILIQDKEQKGSDILSNDDQITLYFLMLSHYLADAHVPPHCDARDFYGPSTIHPDMEKYWDKEIEKYYEFDKERGVFDYDIDGAPELKNGIINDEFKNSILYKVIEELNNRKWIISQQKGEAFNKEILGEGNKKIYDYVKAICYASYLISTDFIPEDVPPEEYKKLKILENPEYKEKLDRLSVCVLADAIDSIAMVWLLTWDKYKALEKEIEEKNILIKKEGKIK